MKFDENLRELRKEKGYSQEELACKLNVTRQTVSKWENGSAMPDLKKLTELAEFFGVSMDDLLKLDVEDGRETSSDNSSFEAYVQYTEQRIAALEESRNQDIRKKFTILICLFTAVMLLLFVCFINYSNGIRNELNSLSINYSYLYNQVNSFNYSGSNNYWGSKSDDVTFSLLSVDPEKPYIVEAQFKYSPMSYAKGSKVYFSVPKEDKSIERLEAEEINGEFVLTTNIDLTVEGEYYFFLDDGNEIVKEELYMDPVYLYCEITTENSVVMYSVSKQSGKNAGSYYFENTYDCHELYWSSLSSDKIAKAEFVVETAGKEVFNQSLDFDNADGSSVIKLSDYTVKMDDPHGILAYVSVTDEKGVKYRYFLTMCVIEDFGDPYIHGEQVQIIFQDENGDVAIGYIDDLIEQVSDIYEDY